MAGPTPLIGVGRIRATQTSGSYSKEPSGEWFLPYMSWMQTDCSIFLIHLLSFGLDLQGASLCMLVFPRFAERFW